MNRAMVPPAQLYQVGELRLASSGPVMDVMTLAEPARASREPTAVVAMIESTSDRRWNRAFLAPHVENRAVFAMSHPHDSAIAGDSLRRLRGDAVTVFEHHLARSLRVGQHRFVDMHHHLVAIATTAFVEATGQRALRNQLQRISSALLSRLLVSCLPVVFE